MKLSRTYMKGTEFKSRQAWLPFVDAVGIVLQVLEPAKAEAWDWFKAWKKAFITKPVKTKKPFQFDIFCQYNFKKYFQINFKV